MKVFKKISTEENNIFDKIISCGIKLDKNQCIHNNELIKTIEFQNGESMCDSNQSLSQEK